MGGRVGGRGGLVSKSRGFVVIHDASHALRLPFALYPHPALPPTHNYRPGERT